MGVSNTLWIAPVFNSVQQGNIFLKASKIFKLLSFIYNEQQKSYPDINVYIVLCIIEIYFYTLKNSEVTFSAFWVHSFCIISANMPGKSQQFF